MEQIMQKITGIKSVDFKITAYGHGVVNWNGSTTVEIFDNGQNKWRDVDNHTMPKLRGYTSKKLKTNKDGIEYEGYKRVDEVDFDKNTGTPLYISQNCIRYHLFKDEVINWQHPKIHENVDKILCSMTGLLRGYVIPKNENKRTSPLLLTDFTEQKGRGNFEQMGRAGSKEKQETKSGEKKSNSHFSKTTFGDTEYIAYGSIIIEQLQFIALSADYGQEAIIITTDKEGVQLAKNIENYIQGLDFASDDIKDKIKAEYHNNYVRKGTIFADGQKGILLNEYAIDVLVKQMLSMIENLTIRQAKGYMYVDGIEVDFNDFSKPRDMFRIKTNDSAVQNERHQPYAVYYQQG